VIESVSNVESVASIHKDAIRKAELVIALTWKALSCNCGERLANGIVLLNAVIGPICNEHMTRHIDEDATWVVQLILATTYSCRARWNVPNDHAILVPLLYTVVHGVGRVYARRSNEDTGWVVQLIED
jgi:hypothetical protein